MDAIDPQSQTDEVMNQAEDPDGTDLKQVDTAISNTSIDQIETLHKFKRIAQ